ncbi:enoyl-CoA hydratase/carnithine racemase [Nocardioides luteus]|uniref:Enoyl-CoA hydratase n=1 Tax=Nocardioides luteus TaxID=1844 RepID=A0ABQ5T0P6_9ACTN|nr:enoyl-CoA hydratase-related protein [Nocardioides luteus]MDR7311677.1 enoyl-CoA hydratase/carnithine racemase [Nocardioides luteus]GGR72525.1 enoyl-CoA hydratase [Nocardioides luteus]GLJ70015.1 enoyl-CoA hydratase [Nocardioides luteus]
MSEETRAGAVRVEDRGHVRILTLDRPERRNALDLADRVDLLEALRDADREARAIVLTGGGSVFSAGGDIRSMSQDRDVARQRLEVVNAVVRQLVGGERPVVAAVEGGAYGLGLALAAACDLVVAGRSATFSTSFGKIGLGPDSGLAHTLPRRVGQSRARELLLTVRTFDAVEAERIGAVETLVDDGTALDHAVEMATRMARLSAPMLAGTRRILGQADQSLDAVLAAEADLQVELLAGPQFAEGRAAFLERRRPDFISA